MNDDKEEINTTRRIGEIGLMITLGLFVAIMIGAWLVLR